MNKLTGVYDPEMISPPTKEEKQLAHTTHQQILALISEVKNSEKELDANYARIGSKLWTMQQKKYWIVLGYSSWNEYFGAIQARYDTGRTQLYAYMGVAKVLLPEVSESDLVEMGVSKASELRKAVQATGQKPTPEILEQAKNPKILAPQFRAQVHEAFHIKDHNEKGTWFDFKGCYLTEDEKATIFEAFDVARRTDPPIPHTWPQHVQFKEIMMRLCQEYLGGGHWREQQDATVGPEDIFVQ